MKKYILGMMAFIMAFTSSCTNDDITISYSTNFKINPSTVIAPFTWEYNAGDLESFDTNFQLRVRLLIYGSDGLLKAEDTQYFTNYSVMMNSSILLPNGSYTAVAITDVMGKTSSAAVSEYWILSDYQKLADTHIDDAGYIGGPNKLLGITKQVFNVDGNSQSDVSINVQPVGALFFVWYRNIHTYSFLDRLGLKSSKTAEKCVFNSDGSYSIVEENNNGSYDWWIDYVDIADYSEYNGVYNYLYVLPTSNLNLKFVCDWESDRLDLSSVMTVNVKAGDEWAFILDMEDEESGKIVCDFGLMNNSRSSSLNLLQGKELGSNHINLNSDKKLYLKNVK